MVKQIYCDKLLFSQQTTCLNYGKICTRQAGQVRGQPNLPVFFPIRIGERASANHAHCKVAEEKMMMLRRWAVRKQFVSGAYL